MEIILKCQWHSDLPSTSVKYWRPSCRLHAVMIHAPLTYEYNRGTTHETSAAAEHVCVIKMSVIKLPCFTLIFITVVICSWKVNVISDLWYVFLSQLYHLIKPSQHSPLYLLAQVPINFPVVTKFLSLFLIKTGKKDHH